MVLVLSGLGLLLLLYLLAATASIDLPAIGIRTSGLLSTLMSRRGPSSNLV